MRKTGLNGHVYDFSVDYDAIAVDGILDIHNYLMKKKKYDKKMFEFIKKASFAWLTTLASINLLTITLLRCISMSNQECRLRPKIVNVKN